MHFTIHKNNELPQEFFHYDRVRVPNKIRPSHMDQMIYDRRTGKLSYFPRKSSFEVYFLGKLLYSKLENGKIPDHEEVTKHIAEISVGIMKPIWAQGKNLIKPSAGAGHRRVQSELEGNYMKQRLTSRMSLNQGNSPFSPYYPYSSQPTQDNSPQKMPDNNYNFSSFRRQSSPHQISLFNRKSLANFNKNINIENDQKFQQLITHRKQYNTYIRIMSHARKSQERFNQQKVNEFDEKIKKKVMELRMKRGDITERSVGSPVQNINDTSDNKNAILLGNKRIVKKRVEIEKSYDIDLIVGRTQQKVRDFFFDISRKFQLRTI